MNKKQEKKVCVICHLHYQELWDEIKNYLHNLEKHTSFDLFITVSSENTALHNKILQEFSSDIDISIQIIDKNPLGADLYPFISVINKINLDNYNVVFKIHSKQNVKNFTTQFPPELNNNIYVGEQLWRNFLLNAILGKHNVKKVLNAFKNPQIGMVGFYPLQILQKEPNSTIPEKLSHLINYDLIDKKTFCNYYGGTIFAIRAELLKPLQNILDYKDFITKEREDCKFSHMAYFLEGFLSHLVISNNLKFYSPYNFIHKKIMQILSHKKSVYIYIYYINNFIFKTKLFNPPKTYNPLIVE